MIRAKSHRGNDSAPNHRIAGPRALFSQRQPPLVCHNSLPRIKRLWPASRSGLATLSQHSFDVGVEAVVAQWLVLVDRQPDIGDGRFIEVGAKQGAIGALPSRPGASHGDIERMWRNDGAWFPQRVAAITGPAVVGRIIDHGGAHWVQLDV